PSATRTRMNTRGSRARRGKRCACIVVPATALLVGIAPMHSHAQEFRQNRADVSGRSGAVVEAHPLAAAAGHDVLRRGGNAVDAAVTMAGVLAVVRPHMNGVGGDAFALFYDASSKRITGLNGSGHAGALATPEFFTARGHHDVPDDGPLTITVPGAV